MAEHENCPTCICGRRAPVQGEVRSRATGKPGRGRGSITWEEHMLAYSAYSARYGLDQSAQRIAERGGFGYFEVTELLGHEPLTWEPQR